jgi:hypothetical protein
MSVRYSSFRTTVFCRLRNHDQSIKTLPPSSVTRAVTGSAPDLSLTSLVKELETRRPRDFLFRCGVGVSAFRREPLILLGHPRFVKGSSLRSLRVAAAT